jgi:AcrR family transcriptional regulator
MDDAPRLRGRQAEAARNDDLILEAARAVFTADPAAPIAAVAARAGVGIAALYRRYPSKGDLLRRLNADGLARYIAEAERALADEGDAWAAFAAFMARVVEADTHALTVRLAGTFAPTAQLWRDGDRAAALTHRLLARTTASGGLRPGIEVGDLTLVFEQLACVHAADPARAATLRQRYLALFLDGLRAANAPPLPGPAPRWEEISGRWRPDEATGDRRRATTTRDERRETGG